jgi:hypothetical protein
MLGCLYVHLVAESVLLLWESVCRSGKRGSDRESAELISAFITNSARKRKLENGGRRAGTKKGVVYSQPDVLMPITFRVEFGFGIVEVHAA